MAFQKSGKWASKILPGMVLVATLASPLTVHALSPVIVGAIAVVGPYGEIISYEKNGDQIIIRQSTNGCQIEACTKVIELSEKDLRTLVKAGHYHSFEEKNLPNQSCVKDRIDGLKDMSALVGAILGHMNGKKVRKILRYSKDHSTPEYKFLKGIVAIQKCSPDKTLKMPVGTICKVDMNDGIAFWQVEKDDAVRDLQSGLVVTRTMGSNMSYNTALSLCPSGTTLPTGYPESLNGKNGFPNEDSDFVTLEKHGIKWVAPDVLESSYFWSASYYPGGIGNAYCYYVGSGRVDGVAARTRGASVLCVGR